MSNFKSAIDLYFGETAKIARHPADGPWEVTRVLLAPLGVYLKRERWRFANDIAEDPTNTAYNTGTLLFDNTELETSADTRDVVLRSFWTNPPNDSYRRLELNVVAGGVSTPLTVWIRE